jgi:hypothetical protein
MKDLRHRCIVTATILLVVLRAGSVAAQELFGMTCAVAADVLVNGSLTAADSQFKAMTRILGCPEVGTGYAAALTRRRLATNTSDRDLFRPFTVRVREAPVIDAAKAIATDGTASVQTRASSLGLLLRLIDLSADPSYEELTSTPPGGLSWHL